MCRIALLLVFLLGATAGPCVAAVFTVTSPADLIDPLPGNGFCSVLPQAGPGPCTLRAAVMESNALAGTDRIDLVAGAIYVLTRAGANEDGAVTGDLDITDSVQIVFFGSGPRPVVDANGLERAFELLSGNATLLGFDITGGEATIASDRSGGAIAVDFDAGIVQLSLLRLYGNRANFGAAVYNDGPSTSIDASELFDNTEVDFGADSTGSAVFNRGGLTLRTSAVFANGGVGGLSSVAVNNRPPNVGTPILSIINSTIASNIGIGVRNEEAGQLVLRNTTIAANTTLGLRVSGVGGSLQMRNTAIVRNDDDCLISAAATLNTNRYNLDSDDTCELADGSSNLVGVDVPLLAPLARRGEFAHAAWLLRGSALVDAGHPVIGAIGCEDADQRFNERPSDGDGDGASRCDIGAIEEGGDTIFYDPFDRL